MSLVPSPSTSRGGITVQPSYFTSSLYVYPLRDDILHLIQVYTEHYVQTQPTQPFALFKTIWNGIGWTWMHFKVFDSKSRETFLKVTSRLFIEHVVDTEPPLNRVVALFGLYTFFTTQPSTEAPSLHSVEHIEIPIDIYTSILTLPQTLTAHMTPLQPHTIHVLSTLVKSHAFYILPASMFHPFNPRELPREIFIQDGYELSVPVNEQLASQGSESAMVPEVPTKKKGRPTKRDKKKKAILALHQVDKWLEKNTVTIQPPIMPDPAPQCAVNATPPAPVITHVLMSHPPITTLNNYRTQKSQLLDAIDPDLGLAAPEPGQIAAREALHRANTAVLARMRKLDQMAAEKGLEVGGEGGERTGLGRVEKAVTELRQTDVTSGRRGGILGLLEGGGMMSAPDNGPSIPSSS